MLLVHTTPASPEVFDGGMRAGVVALANVKV
jgi:hypothetical protein